MDTARQQRTNGKKIYVSKSKIAELSDILTASESIKPGIDRAQYIR
jgi:hypothetical protein